MITLMENHEPGYAFVQRSGQEPEGSRSCQADQREGQESRTKEGTKQGKQENYSAESQKTQTCKQSEDWFLPLSRFSSFFLPSSFLPSFLSLLPSFLPPPSLFPSVCLGWHCA